MYKRRALFSVAGGLASVAITGDLTNKGDFSGAKAKSSDMDRLLNMLSTERGGKWTSQDGGDFILISRS